MAALNSQTHTYTRTRLRFLCLQVCFLIWSGCTDQINRVFSSCFHHAQERAEFSNDIHGLSDRKGMGTGGCDLRGSSADCREATNRLLIRPVICCRKKERGKKNSWPSGTCQSNYPSHVNKSKPRGTAVEPSNTNTQTEFTWIPGFSRS